MRNKPLKTDNVNSRSSLAQKHLPAPALSCRLSLVLCVSSAITSCPVVPPVLSCYSPALSVLFCPVPVLSCPVFSSSCPVISCSVLHCLVLSCPVLSCPVLSCPVLSCAVLSCYVLFCPVLSCPVVIVYLYFLQFCPPVLASFIQFFSVVSCSVWSCPFCPALKCPVLSCPAYHSSHPSVFIIFQLPARLGMIFTSYCIGKYDDLLYHSKKYVERHLFNPCAWNLLGLVAEHEKHFDQSLRGQCCCT
jgi:hypothetical protein